MDLRSDHRPGCLSFGEFVIDLADERLVGPDGPVKIGRKAYRVLLALIEQEGRLLTKEALFTSVWDGTIVSESALTSVIKELRRALGDGSRKPRFIASVYGRGYRFLAPVETLASRPGPTAAAPPARRQAAADATTAATTQPPVVVVAPFEDASVHEDYPHCAAQLREEVLSGLARFREIQLVTEEDCESPAIADLGRRGYRLAATLLPDSDGVRVVARATRISDGRVIWAETLSLFRQGTAAGVERIVRRIVGSALPAVDDDLYLGLPELSEAFYDRYLIAKRNSVAATTGEEARAAAAELEAIISERPDFGLAYPPLVRLYNTDFGFTELGGSGPAERDRALELARAGLAADRGNVHAYTVLGFCYIYHCEARLARDSFEQALTLNPYNPVRVSEVATGMIYLGEFDRARELFVLGHQLQLFADDSFREDEGRLALVADDFEAARASLLAIANRTIWSDLYLALSEYGLGRPSAPGRIADWLERVSRAWHDGEEVGSGKLLSWVRWHHPFQDSSGERLFSLVEKALEARPTTRPAAMPVAE
jgi:DNA-binding winged helix-turn-helix (wHTH) protein